MSEARWEIREGDALDRLRGMPAGSVQCCVTSPPYFGLRDYGTGEWIGGEQDCSHVIGRARQDTNRETPGGRGGSFRGGDMLARNVCHCGARRVDRQIGLEASPDEFVAALVAVFREVRRVLRADGTLWLNIGDAYCNIGHGKSNRGEGRAAKGHRETEGTYEKGRGFAKHKDLLGIPWLLAFALRADGWWLRSDIIWAKPNPMPESVTDRPTSAHEHLFLLAKSPRYFYDADAIREPATYSGPNGAQHAPGGSFNNNPRLRPPMPRNKRNVWEIATQPYAEAHFATFPPKLVEPCVLAGCPEGGTILDPFAGAGTTGVVALRHGRSFVGIELNPVYAELARKRIRNDAPLLNHAAETAARSCSLPLRGVSIRIVWKRDERPDPARSVPDVGPLERPGTRWRSRLPARTRHAARRRHER